jgi:hypothetical protein
MADNDDRVKTKITGHPTSGLLHARHPVPTRTNEGLARPRGRPELIGDTHISHTVKPCHPHGRLTAQESIVPLRLHIDLDPRPKVPPLLAHRGPGAREQRRAGLIRRPSRLHASDARTHLPVTQTAPRRADIRSARSAAPVDQPWVLTVIATRGGAVPARVTGSRGGVDRIRVQPSKPWPRVCSRGLDLARHGLAGSRVSTPPGCHAATTFRHGWLVASPTGILPLARHTQTLRRSPTRS